MLLLWLIQILLKSPLDFLIVFSLLVIPLLISVTIHEWSHGVVAYKFGDPTPKLQGRLSFNPLAHLDPIGTLMLFIIGIGWAKPVVINPDNIHGKTKQMLVAFAGPASNFLLAIIFSLILYGINHFAFGNANIPDNSIAGMIANLIKLIIQINIILALFNLLPIPPLDGSNILSWLLPEGLANIYSRLAPFGMIILIIILFTVGFRFIFDAAKVVEVHMYNVIEKILNPIFF